MGLMDKFNKGGATFDVDITNFKFVDLATMYKIAGADAVVGPIDGLYINKKSSFGDHPVAIIANDEILVDLPAHLVEDVKAILQDPEVVEAIKAGKVGFSIHEYEQKKYKKLCYGIHWEDIA